MRVLGPLRVTAQSWTAIGGENRCAFCDGLIGHLELDYELEKGLGADNDALHVHGLCYYRLTIEWLCMGSDPSRESN